MKILDIIRDDHRDRISSTKLWFSVGYAVVTFGYIWSIVHGQSFESSTLVYAPFVSGLKLFDKWMLLKFGAGNVKSIPS